MPTQTQPWLRAELIAAPETTPGAQLMIPADGVEFHDDQLVFHHQGDIVYVAPQSQLRSITWFAKQPNPETARRKAQWPKHGTRWTDEERADLLRHLRNGHSWKAISHAHGRSRTGCQQEAIKQGWLDPDTLQPTATLLLAQPDPAPDAQTPNPDNATQAPAPPMNAAPADAAASPPPTDAAATSPLADPAHEPVLGNASADPRPIAMPAGPATSSPQNPAATPASASPLHGAMPTDAASASPQNALPANASAGPPPIAPAAPAVPIPPREPVLTDAAAASAAEPPISWPAASPSQGTARIPSPPRPTPSATSSPGAELVVGSVPSPDSPLLTTPSATPIAPDPLASASAAPQPDRPRIPPRVPRQRATPSVENLPAKGDPDKDSDPGSGSGSRFLSRAQSSLARATLGAYMNPPRGQSGATSGAT